MHKMVKIGCCGWSFFNPKMFFGENWKEKYRSTLQAYASLFDLVEVNSTFYRLPRIRAAERWLEDAREVNDRFEFSVKASRQITHELRFGKESLHVFDQLKEVARALDARIIVFQTPASFKPAEENLERAREFFSSIDRNGFTLVWEVRWQDVWNEHIVKSLFSELELEHATDPFRQESYCNKKLYYYRLHGLGKRLYDYKFDKEKLEVLKKNVLSKTSEGKEVYVFFNNHTMYEDALTFSNMLGE